MNPYFYKAVDEVDNENIDVKAKDRGIEFLKNTL